MAENVYEGLFILDSNRYGRDPEAVAGQIPKMIQKADGKILVSRLWEERRLAYPIKGHRKGTYWLTYSRLDGNQLADIERQCQLSESILRVLFTKVEPQIVDAVVAHAQAAHTPAASPGGDKATPATKAEHHAGEKVAVTDHEGADQPESTDESTDEEKL